MFLGQRPLLLGALALLGGCGGAITPVPPPAEVRGVSASTADVVPASTSEDEPRVMLSVEDRPLLDALRILARTTDDPIVVDPAAQPIARCASITIISPRRLGVAEAVDLLDDAIRVVGLRLERRGQGMIVRRLPDAPPLDSCRGAAATAVETPDGGLPPAITSVPTPRTLDTGIPSGIRRLSPTEHLMTREVMDRAFANQSDLMRMARVIPREEGGHITGFRIYGVRRSSLLGLLGFQNGDEVRSVNGHSMASMEAALQAYADMRVADRVTVEIQRRGAPTTMTIRIVDQLP